jgi:Domain of unknown function (DUF397)
MTGPGPHSLTRAIWRKSSYSSPTSNDCVEVAASHPADIAVRDSKDPDGQVLAVASGAWRDFIAAVKAGEHDLIY